MKGHGKQFMTSAVLALALVGAPSRAHAAADSRGTEFWLMFTQNYSDSPTRPKLSLFIAGSTATTGTVEVPGIGFATGFTVTPGVVTTVQLPDGDAQVYTSGVVGNLGIHVTAADEVTVYGLNRIQYTTDAYLGLPNDILGTEYLVLSYPGGLGSEIGVVATQDATAVTITPPSGSPITIAMDEGQTYQLQAGNDLSGALITSDKPVGVWGGNRCVNIPPGYYACDYIVEQLPPTSTWGKQFVTMPLATRTGGDTFRILASADGTVVNVNGVAVATLARGQVHERLITGPATIDATGPILVAQYSNGSSFDGVTSDPFMMLIPPFEQFLADYTVSTPATGFATNFVNLVTPAAAVGQVLLDGVAVPAASFTAIGTSGFSGAQVGVSPGSHHLSSPQPFGAFVYGFDAYDSYGYPGGMSVAPVARVTTVSLSPRSGSATVGSAYCVTATVLDQFGAAVPGVRVDFTVSGANTVAGFQSADEVGQARFCYVGQSTGDDGIGAAVGTITDGATITWGALSDQTSPTCAVPTAFITTPRKGVEATVQDVDSGIATIEPLELTNATMEAAFTPGTKDPVKVRFLKEDATKASRFTIRITDLAGNQTVCDPPLSGEVAVAAPRGAGGCGTGASGLVGLLGLAAVGLLRRRVSKR